MRSRLSLIAWPDDWLSRSRLRLGRDDAGLTRLAQPLPRIDRSRMRRAQHLAQVCHRAEIVDRAEVVDVRQHGTNTGRARLEGVETQQGVEPDQPAAGALETVHFEGELG